MDKTIFRLAFEDRDRYFSRIERVYQVLARMQDRPGARFFCEKLFEANVVRALDVMMGARKKIFLVRHPCAAYLSRKRFDIAMHKGDGGAHEDNLFFMQAEMMAKEYAAHKNNNRETLLLKQEEMLEDIDAVAGRIEDFIGVTIDRERLAQSETRVSASPILSKSIKESAAEWKQELDADTIAQVKQRTSLYAATFDYGF